MVLLYLMVTSTPTLVTAKQIVLECGEGFPNSIPLLTVQIILSASVHNSVLLGIVSELLSFYAYLLYPSLGTSDLLSYYILVLLRVWSMEQQHQQHLRTC